MLERVAVVVLPGVAPFELGVTCELFGLDRSDMGVPRIDFRLVTPDPGPVRASVGFDLVVRDGLEAAGDADLVCVPACLDHEQAHPGVIDLLNRTVADGRRVMSVCSGAFVLGHAGLLDGRVCTTHWMHTEELAQRFPAAKVDPMVLYVDDGPVLTSAGTAAGIDLGLYILRQEFGPAAAGVVARRMVVPPHRDGGQAQYIDRPIPSDTESFGPLLDWMLEHLDDDLTVDALARRAGMSPRTFARRFAAETGTTPHRWLVRHRVAVAADLLESTDLGLDEIARRVGLGDAALLRHHFKALRGATPRAYRATFRGRSGSSLARAGA